MTSEQPEGEQPTASLDGTIWAEVDRALSGITARAERGVLDVIVTIPRDEVVRGLSHQVDQEYPFPANHWAQEPAPDWSHDPFTTRIYPQYNTPDREEGIGRYWD